MPSLRSIILVAVPLLSTVLANPHPQRSNHVADPETFRELLNAVPEESLHAVLDNHLRPKYQNGVFEQDKKALERVHHDDPSLASKLVIYAAKLELLKRQSSNSTASSGSEQSNSPTPSSGSPSSQTPATPATVTVTDSRGSTVVVTPTSAQPTPTVSVEVPVTTTDSRGSTIVTSTRQPALVITSTNSAGQATVITTPSPTLGQAITTTDDHGSTFITTYTPGGGVVSSMVLKTTTLPNGDVATITSYEIVNANPTNSAGDATKPTTTRGAPNLQSGAANVLSRRWGAEAAALVGGAVGFAWLL